MSGFQFDQGGKAGGTGLAVDDGAGGGWVAAEAATVGAVQRVVCIFGVQGLAGDAAQFSQSGDGRRPWQGLSLDLGEGSPEGRRVWVGVDGAIEVIGEAAHATMKPAQDEEGGTPVDGIEEIGRERIRLGEGYQVPGGQAEFIHDAAEGVGEPAFSMGTEMPMHGSGGHGVAGGTADVGAGGVGFAEGQVGMSAVEIAAAVALVVFHGSDGGFSFGVGWFDRLTMSGSAELVFR